MRPPKAFATNPYTHNTPDPALDDGTSFRERNTVRQPYRGTSLTKKRTRLGPFSRPMPGVLGGSQEGGRFLMARYPCTADIFEFESVSGPLEASLVAR